DAVDQHLAFVGRDDAQDGLDGDGLAGARAADDDQRGAGLDGQVDAVQHHLGAEALLDADELDLWCHAVWNSKAVRTKSVARIRMQEETTALVVAAPTPCAPPLELKPL